MQMRKGQEKKSEQLLVKFEEEEIHIDEIKQLRDKDHRIHNERKVGKELLLVVSCSVSLPRHL
jgi:uncharacterized protein (DUF1697 family)